MIIQPALHRWCIEQTLGKVIFLGIKKTRRSIYQYLPTVFPHCFFLVLGSEGFCFGPDFSAPLLKIFMKLSGSDFPATRFLYSPCDSFLKSQYSTYRLPKLTIPRSIISFVDQTICALGHERVVDDKNPFFDTTRMIKKDHRVPVQASGDEWQLLSRIPPSTDDTSIIVFVEFSYIAENVATIC